MKIVAALLIALSLGVGFLLHSVLPNKFHTQIHRELLPAAAKDSALSYKRLSSDRHKTIVDTDGFTVEVTSVTSLDPSSYHLLLTLKRRKDGKTIKIKAYPRIGKSLNLVAELEDFKHKTRNESLSFEGTTVTASVPMDLALVDDKERLPYILGNLSLSLSAEILRGNFKEASTSKDASWIIKSPTIAISSESSLEKDQLSFSYLLSLKEIDVRSWDINKNYKNFHQKLSLGAFSIKGLQEKFQELLKLGDFKSSSLSPMMLLGVLPTLNLILHYPFKMKTDFESEGDGGVTKFDWLLQLKDLKNHGLKDFLTINSTATVPKKATTDYLALFLASKYSSLYADQLYLPSIGNSDQTQDQRERERMLHATKHELEKILVGFFKNESEGILALNKTLAQIIQKDLLIQSDGHYSAHLKLERGELLVNRNKVSFYRLRTIVPDLDLRPFLLKKGFLMRESLTKTSDDLPTP